MADDVDVVVVGGSGGAVEAACEAARGGTKVFLVEARPYLGTDLCTTLRLWLEDGEQPQTKLAATCFGKDRMTTPYRVKAEMDRALMKAGVSYLTGSYLTDVLRDGNGRLAGIVMVNRSGRQAIRAKVVIDATPQATVARLAGASFRPFTPGPQTFTRVVIGGAARSGQGVTVAQKEFTCDLSAQGRTHRLAVYEYVLAIDLPDNGPVSVFRAENRARDLTNGQGSEVASEVLHYVPSDTIVGQQQIATWPGAERADLGAFRPKGVAHLYVLGPYTDLGRRAAERLLRPVELMAMGARIGQAAAAEAQGLSRPEGVVLAGFEAKDGIAISVGEDMGHVRPTERGTIRAGASALPVLGRYEVVVVGGGTSGAPAGIAAAKSGARTLVIEYLHELGGVGTTGLIAAYWYGLQRGYTEYVDRNVNPGRKSWNAVAKAEWLRSELTAAGADVWLGAMGCGALVQDGKVCGVVVATPWGRGAVLASTVVDATGNCDIAACAGAETEFAISTRGSLNVQIAGFPERPLGQSYVNTCYTMVDDTDALDVWHLMAWRRTHASQPGAFDVGQLVDSRERRRVVGNATLTVEDILGCRTFPDTISQHSSNFDAAAFPDARLLLVRDAKGPCFRADLPYRCLLPKGLDGILVIGLGASADRDAMTLIRMQPDLQNQGYAAGIAAAAAAKAGGHTRDIDVKAVQRRLVDENVLDSRVLTDKDSFPASVERIERAVRTLADRDDPGQLAALAIVLTHRQEAIDLLKRRYRDLVAEETKLYCARVLGILGDRTGVPQLIAAVEAHDGWDQGMALTSQRDKGNLFSDLDRLVIALGCSGAPEAVPPLLRKLEQLQPESRLSHYKAVSLALWDYDCPAAAEPLARLLGHPGFCGHATVAPVAGSAATASPRLTTAGGDDAANNTNLNRAMKELIVAAMLFRCGDRDGAAKAVLDQYARDIHGHFARYARWVLE